MYKATLFIFKSWFFHLFALLISIISFANERIDPYLTAAITSEPSSIVCGCVNAITGDFVFSSTDLIATGQESSRLNHVYTSRLRNSYFPCGLFLGEHFFIQSIYNSIFFITEPSGFQLSYALPAFNLYGIKEIKRHIESDHILQLTPDSLKNLSNSSRLEISGRANVKNNRVIYNQNARSITIHTSDGSSKYYSALPGHVTDLIDDKYKKKGLIKINDAYYRDFMLIAPHTSAVFRLDKEKLPNGNWIFYSYNDRNWPVEIKTTNPSGTKIYSKINIKTGNELVCTTSCNKTLKIQGQINIDWPDQIVGWQKNHWKTDKVPIIRGYTYRSKNPPEAPEESYNILNYHGKVIQDCILPDKRRLHIDYYSLGNHIVNNTSINIPNTQDPRFMRVKSISIPDKNGDLKTLYYFIYHPGILDKTNGFTQVFDAEGNQTIYNYSKELRLESIDNYKLENNKFKKINSEKFSWGKNNEATFLLSKTLYEIEDENQEKAIFSKRFIYDANGNIIKEISFGNLSGENQIALEIQNGLPIENKIETFSVERSFNNKNLLVQQKDDSGLITTYTYQHNTDKITSKFIAVLDPKNIKQRFFYEYDSDNILIKEIKDDGTSLDKNDLTNVTRRLIKVINPTKQEPYGLTESIEERYLDLKTLEEKLIRKEKFSYNENRKVIKKEVFDSNDVLRYFLKYDYDEKGNIKFETNPLGKEAIYRYDKNDNKEYEKDFAKKEFFFDYDPCNRLIKKTIKDTHKTFTEEYEYDLKGNKILEKDIYGNIKRYEYDSCNNLIKEIYPEVKDFYGSIHNPIKKYSYDNLNRQNEKIDPLSHLTKISYNARNQPILIEYPDNTTEKNVYYLDGTLKEHINQEGTITRYEYDYLKRVISKKIFSSTNELLREKSYEYNAFDLLSKKDPDGNITKYTYDYSGKKIKKEFISKEGKLLELVEYFYDSRGFLTKKIQANKLITHYIRDELGQILEKRKENNENEVLFKKEYEYDDAGNKKSIISYIAGNKSTEKRVYDVFDRLIESIDVYGNKSTITYDEFYLKDLNQKVKQTIKENPIHQKTIITYDALNREKIIEKKNPHNQTVSLEEKFYDLNNNKTFQKSTIYNPDKSTKVVITSWEYDNMNRVKTLKEAFQTKDEKTTHYTYTNLGKLKTIKKPQGFIIKNRYDPIGNKIKVTSSKKDIDYRFTYNNLNQLVHVDDKVNSFQITRKYDALGHLLEEITPTFTIKNEFDLLGNKTKCIFPNSSSVQYTYDPINLKLITRKDSNDFVLYTHEFLEYDLSGNLLKENLISNIAIVDYEIDLLGQITSLKTPYHTQNISFDEIGRISKISWEHFLDSSSEYKYDDLNQIISETGFFPNNYEFDSHYNRLKKNKDSYQINDLNQIISTNQRQFTYDKNGNPLTKKTKYGEMKYFYDSLDRLIKIEKPKSSILEFQYDAFNRRISKKTYLYSCLHGFYENDFKYFLYDDQNEIGSFDKNFIQKELRILSNTDTAEIGSAISFEIDQNIYAPLYDISGNVVSLINKDALQEHYRYSAFGERKIFTASGNEKKSSQINNPWQFSSKRIDEESHLIYFGRRYYNPKLGKWLTTDPEGTLDSLNLYAFVLNNPLIKNDLYGLYANPWMFPKTTQRENDFTAAMFHKTADFGVDTLKTLSHVGFGVSSPFLYSYHAITQKGSLKNDFQRHLQNINMIDRDVKNFMQRVIPADQSSKAYRTSSMITGAIFDGAILGSLICGGYSATSNLAKNLGSIKNFKIDIKAESLQSISNSVIIENTTKISNFKNQIWSSTQRKSSVENAYSHWIKHKNEFPDIMNSKQYVIKAHKFINNPPKGTLIKNVNHELIYYDPITNTFAVKSKNGLPCTMFKPNKRMNYWLKQ